MGKVFKLKNGMLLLSTEAPGGVYNSAQLKKIASLCDGETAVVKATEDQRLALFVVESQVARVTRELHAVGLGVRNYQDGLHQPVNCLGELCAEHAQDAMGASMDLADELKALKIDSPLKIGINGCSRVCVASHTLDVSIIGDANGYRISLGGKNSQIPEMASFMAEGVPAEKLPKLVAKVLGVYQELAQKDETLQDVMERVGTKRFAEALHPYSQDAAEADPFAGMGDGGEAGGVGVHDMKIDELPTSEETGETLPEVSDDLSMDELSADDMNEGPNFEDVGPAADEEILVDAGAESSHARASARDDVLDEASGADPEVAETLNDDLLLAEATVINDGLEDIAARDAESGPDAVDEIVIDDSELNFAAEELPVAPADEPLKALSLVPAVKEVVAADAALEDDMAADEVGEDEADAFEAKINESIAEEESMPEVEDVNSAARLEAVKLVESGADMPSVDAVQEALETDGSFENLEIEQDHELDFSEVEEDEGALEEVQAPVASVAAAAPVAAVASTGFDLAGVELDDDGRVILSFASGANVMFDPATLQAGAKRDLIVGGKRVVLKAESKGTSVEADGVTVFLPRRAA